MINKLFLNILMVLLVVGFYSIATAKKQYVDYNCTVTKVIDGDTIQVEGNFSDGSNVHLVRLYGIDAPEISKYSKKGKLLKKGQPFGEESYKTLSEKILGKDVRIEVTGVDIYKRYLAVIYIDTRVINLEMVDDGMAWAYTKYLNKTNMKTYIAAEKLAVTTKKGIWSGELQQTPWDFRNERK